MVFEIIQLVASYAFLCLGTTLLWMSEGGEGFPYPTVVALLSVLALVWSDWRKTLRLSIIVSNVIALFILLAIILESRGDTAGFLSGLGHLLIYLQVAKSFRPKTKIDFLLLFAINFLQVAIAAVLNRSLAFGGILSVYLLLGLVALVMTDLLEDRPARSPRRQMAPARGMGWVGFQVALVWLSAIPLGIGLFLIIPRFEPGALAARIVSPTTNTSLVGFSEYVRLDETSNIQQSDALAFTVRVVDSKGNSIELDDECLWRGTVFTTYHEREWLGAPRGMLADRSAYWPTQPPPMSEDTLRYEIELTPSSANVLFSPSGVFWAGSSSPDYRLYHTRLDDRVRLVGRDWRSLHGATALSYELLVSRKNPVPMSPSAWKGLADYLELSTRVPPHLSRLRVLAEGLTAGIRPDDERGKIRRIVNYLTDPARFSYTLNIRPVEAKLDPVEDFLWNRKAGHCEYFASALALLLRSVGVPTRVVNGFKGAVFDPSTGRYQVRQWMAHSWVEVYLADVGEWRAVESTPAESAEVRGPPARTLAGIGRESYQRFLGYVLEYSNTDQAQLFATLVEQPARELWQGLWLFLTNLPAAAGRWSEQEFWRGPRGWAGVAAALMVVLSILFRGRIARWGERYWGGWWRNSTPRFRPHERFARLLARSGLRRRLSQTPAEFADQVGTWLGADEHTRSWANLPGELVREQYRVRYGGLPASAEREATLDRAVLDFARNGLAHFTARRRSTSLVDKPSSA